MENQQKSNIPLLIIATFLGFGLFIGYMVYQAFQTDVNLVQTDYYQNSTLHNEHVDDIKRSEAVDIKLYFDRKLQAVIFQIPSEFDKKKVSGKLHFYRPSDSKIDFTIPIKITNSSQSLNVDEIKKGKWNVKASFSFDGDNYYKESTFTK